MCTIFHINMIQGGKYEIFNKILSQNKQRLIALLLGVVSSLIASTLELIRNLSTWMVAQQVELSMVI